MSVTFPLCREPAHEVEVRRVIDGCVTFLRTRLPAEALVAVVLTGSFARGEGTVLAENGRLRVLGDIEFLVILASDVDHRAMRPAFARWGREAAPAVGGERVRVDVEFGPVGVGYVRGRARPSIFVHDLVQHGKVVWGPSDLLAQIPPFGAADIPREDALFLLFNRTIEQLEAWERLADAVDDALLDVAYQRWKLLLDLAGSALAFVGNHTSSYQRRPSAFANLVSETPSLQTRLPAGFQGELERAARAKVAPGASDIALLARLPAAAMRAELEAQIVGGVPAVAAFLGWELEQILGTHDTLPALLARYLGTQPVSRRAWDWAKVALHPMPAPLPLSPLRAARLFARSTPRGLLYAAGTLAYLGLGGDDRRAATIADLLPVRRRALPRDAAGQRRAIAALWRWCIRNN